MRRKKATEPDPRQLCAFEMPIPKPVEPLTFTPPTHWAATPPHRAATPPHRLGEEVALLHPNGNVKIARIARAGDKLVSAQWPNCGQWLDFRLSSGECTRRSYKWILSPEDLNYLRQQREKAS